MGSGSASASADALSAYLARPRTPGDAAVLAAINVQAPRAASLRLADIDRLADPAPLPCENGWWLHPDGTQEVAVCTAMPGVTSAMVDWWFDWHPRDAMRYRVWHPDAHHSNRLVPAATPAAKAHWGATHHPVEDLGTGMVHARIAFAPPSVLGFQSDYLDHPDVGTVVAGFVGDDRRRTWHSVMAHVFLHTDDGLSLRSHFWLGARIVPFLPSVLARPLASLLRHPRVLTRTLAADTAPALARHCVEEYSHLAVILPELWGTFGASESGPGLLGPQLVPGPHQPQVHGKQRGHRDGKQSK